MKVFRPHDSNTWHLVLSSRWEKSTELKDSISFNQLMVMRVQLFCEDAGRLRYQHERFAMAVYDREKHLKKMCKECVLKAKKSKRYGPKITEENPDMA